MAKKEDVKAACGEAASWKKLATSGPVLISFATLVCLLSGIRFAGSTGYWFDELWSVEAVRGGLPRMLGILMDDVHPPLYHLLLWGWVRIFGYSEFATHTLSALLAASSAPAIYLLGRRLSFPPRLALPAALIAAAGYAVTTYGHETRPYALGFTLSMWTIVLVAHPFNWKAFSGALFVGLAGIFAHYTVAIPLAVSVLALALRFDRRWVLLPLGWAVAMLPASLQISKQAGKFMTLGWLDEPTAIDVILSLRFLSGLPAGEYAALAVGWLALAAFLWRRRYHKDAWLFIAPVTVALFFILSHLWQPVFHHRYLLPLAAWWALTIVYLVSLIPRSSTQGPVAMFLAAGFILASQLGTGAKAEDWRAPAEYVMQAEGELPVVVSENDRFFRHYLPDAMVFAGQETSALRAWLKANAGVRFWFLQARDFSATPFTTLLAEETEIIEIHNFPQTRAVLLRSPFPQGKLADANP